jgi:hypothetical protein
LRLLSFGELTALSRLQWSTTGTERYRLQLKVTVTENEVSHIAYERSPAKADVELRFTQEKSQNGWMMMLVIRNKLKHRLYLDALMTIPGKEEILKTQRSPYRAKSQ